MGMLPLILAAAAPPAQLFPGPPAPARDEACVLPPQWAILLGGRVIEKIPHNKVSIAGGRAVWNGEPVDDQRLGAFARSAARTQPRPAMVLYLAIEECDAMNRVAALIDAEAGCPPGYCLLTLDPPPPVRVPPPPPAPAGPAKVTPRGSPQSWVTNDDYPLAALWEYHQGTTSFSLRIDATGRIADCAITESSGSPHLDEATCALLAQRARFNPARNADGVAIEGEWGSRFRWMLPTDRAPLASWAEVTRYRIDGSGAYSNCSTRSYGRAPGIFTLCRESDFNPVRGMGRAQQVEIRVIHMVDGSALALPRTGGEILFRRTIRYTVDATGDPVGCQVTEEVGADRLKLNKYRCNPAMDYPADEAAKKPGRGVTYTISVTVTPIKP